jgi:hypothetical protein
MVMGNAWDDPWPDVPVESVDNVSDALLEVVLSRSVREVEDGVWGVVSNVEVSEQHMLWDVVFGVEA